MAADSEDYTTFACRFGAFRWKVLPFGLLGRLPRGNVLNELLSWGTLMSHFLSPSYRGEKGEVKSARY